jgi:RpiB/LacA/LacB family sugar-phosphate isomerase
MLEFFFVEVELEFLSLQTNILVLGSTFQISHFFFRAALCHDHYSSVMCRKHNNANVLCFGGRNTGEDVAKEMVDNFLTTEFEGILNERHQKRIDKITIIEKENKL